MGFCPAANESYSKLSSADNYFLKPFQSSNTMLPNYKSCLPANINIIIGADGQVNTAELNNHIDIISTYANPPGSGDIVESATNVDSPNNPTKLYANKAATLREEIKKEYCWYYNRYSWAMQKILTNVASTDGAVDEVIKNGATELNKKLNVILLIMKGLVNSRLSVLRDYYGDGERASINALNTQLDKARTNLLTHSNKLRNNDLSSDVQTAMIEYSLEKNSSSRNLLAIYGFMNIIAAGLLFYIYTKSKV